MFFLTCSLFAQKFRDGSLHCVTQNRGNGIKERYRNKNRGVVVFFGDLLEGVEFSKANGCWALF